jgi:hypothetical protein
MTPSSGAKATPGITASQGSAVVFNGNFPPIDTPGTHDEPNVEVDVVDSRRVEITVQFGTATPIEIVIQLS